MQVKEFRGIYEPVWVTDKETQDLEEARSLKQKLDLYYKQVQIVERTTEENVIE